MPRFATATVSEILVERAGLQRVDTDAAEETRPDLPEALDGLPVVACSLHSQVAVVAAVVRHLRPTARIAYVMTDGAALPLALSDLAHRLRERGVVDITITAGHAFGGDLEAVSMPAALALARHVAAADIAIVGMGPGVVGTASSLGTTAVEVAAIADAAAALGGRVAVCCRVSSADSRERHRGISHHVHTALRLTCHRPEVPLPTGLAAVVDGAENDAFRRAFERDKDDLRAMGVPLEVQDVPGVVPAVEGYRIPKDRYYLRDPGLTAEELAALRMAASVVQLDGLSAREGLLKLGGLVGEADGAMGVAVAGLPRGHVGSLFGAIAARTPVRFTYRGVERRGGPYPPPLLRGGLVLT